MRRSYQHSPERKHEANEGRVEAVGSRLLARKVRCILGPFAKLATGSMATLSQYSTNISESFRIGATLFQDNSISLEPDCKWSSLLIFTPLLLVIPQHRFQNTGCLVKFPQPAIDKKQFDVRVWSNFQWLVCAAGIR